MAKGGLRASAGRAPQPSFRHEHVAGRAEVAAEGLRHGAPQEGLGGQPRPVSSGAICQGVLKALEDFQVGAQADDTAIVVMRFCGV